MSNDNKKMDVKYWEGGLTLHEVKAIEKIAQAFSGANQKQVTKPARLGSLRPPVLVGVINISA